MEPAVKVRPRDALNETKGLDPHKERQAFRTELMERIKTLGLQQNVIDMDTNGYSVIENAGGPGFCQELRDAVLELTNARRSDTTTVGDRRGIMSFINKNTLTKGRAFEKAVMNEKMYAIMQYLLGDGCVLNSQSATIVSQGGPALFLHTDNAYVPEPFPSWAVTATAVWATEDHTVATGASRIVPGSHKWLRNPRPGEADDLAVPIICPAGSVQIWNGATWHGNCGRTAPGDRVTVHTSFARMCFNTFANNALVTEDVIDRNPGLAQMLGRDLPYRMEYDNGSDPALMGHAARLSVRIM